MSCDSHVTATSPMCWSQMPKGISGGAGLLQLNTELCQHLYRLQEEAGRTLHIRLSHFRFPHLHLPHSIISHG